MRCKSSGSKVKMSIGTSEDKLSYGQMAEKLGCSKPTIANAVKELEIRPINGPNRAKLLMPSDQARITEWWQARTRDKQQATPVEIEVYDPCAVVYSAPEQNFHLPTAARVLGLFSDYFSADSQQALDLGMIEEARQEGTDLGMARFAVKYGTAHQTEQRMAGDAAKAMGLESKLDPSKFEKPEERSGVQAP